MEYLKIKEDIDLSELKKFGFEKEKHCYIYNNTESYIVVYHNKFITLCGDYEISECPDVTESLPKLFELFKADLIEKVVEK